MSIDKNKIIEEIKRLCENVDNNSKRDYVKHELEVIREQINLIEHHLVGWIHVQEQEEILNYTSYCNSLDEEEGGLLEYERLDVKDEPLGRKL